MASGFDSTKTGARPAHEAIEPDAGKADSADETPQERIDKEAMELAKRAQNRFHKDETKVPGSSIFTK